MVDIKNMHSDYFKLLYFSISAEMAGIESEERYVELLERLKLDWSYFYPISSYFLHMASMPVRYGLTKKSVETLIKSSIEVDRLFNSVDSSTTSEESSECSYECSYEELEEVVYSYIVSCREIVKEMSPKETSEGQDISIPYLEGMMREVVWN